MPYVKISDPNIIDLGAWQQVINVVNQHSDSINSITNNFGVQGSGTVDWNADSNIVHEYNPGNQKILYGRTKVVVADASDLNTNQVVYGDVSFADASTGTTAFSARPVMAGALQFGHTSIGALSTTSHNIVFNIFHVTESQFSFRITLANSTSTTNKITGTFYLNWQATGPK
jgi:hypothetical protein